MKKSIFGRSIELVSLAGRLAQKEITQSLKNRIDASTEKAKTRIEQARILAESLSQLKGAAMKVGQLLSLDSSDILPREVIDVLATLQSGAKAEDFNLIQEVLRRELGEKLQLLTHLNPVPLAAASIGQVHQATYQQKQVAIKVQYPGVDQSIDSDLAILRKVCEGFLKVTGRAIDLTDLFNELTHVLRQETDYLAEAKHLRTFKEKLALDSRYIVPKTIDELTTKKVLTMSFENGLSIQEWLDKIPSKEQKQLIATSLLDLYCLEFFEWGLVQTDPNYANFKIQPDTDKLILLDFGATLSYPPEFREKYKDLLRAFASLNDELILKAAINFNLLDPRESSETQRQFVAFLKSSFEPFMPENQPFQFKNQDYAMRSAEIGRSFTQSLRYSPPPRELIFLHRKLGGIFNLLRKLDVSLNLTPYWKKMVGIDFT